MREIGRVLPAALAWASAALAPASARAERGVYGRFDGDVDLGLHLGAQVDRGSAAAAASATAHYLHMAGVGATFVDALGSSTDLGSRLLSVGVDVRPAFIPRWTSDMEQGPSSLDLTIDSLSVGVGPFWAWSSRFGAR